MAAEPQLLFDLLDFNWFAHQIFNKPQTPPSKYPQNKEPTTQTSQNLDFSVVPTINKTCQNEVKEVEETKEVTITPVEKCERGIRRKKIKRSKSKSLSELEFEELKGFMDLGFLFSENDKDSSLVSIIPGLQRLGKDDEKEDVIVSRPYLSEAWSDMEYKMKSILIKIPAFGSGNEADVKHQLRFWAHSVAAVVR